MPPQGRCVKPMWTSYGGWARSGGLPEVDTLIAVTARLERWTLPLAILMLFTYPNPLVLPALALVALSGIVRLARRGWLAQAAPVDPWIGLLALGTAVGLVVAHSADAALLRFTGVVGALAAFYAVRGYIRSENEVRQTGLAALGATVLGILVVLALLRGVLPESSVTTALSPLLSPFSVFPGVSGDALEVNARFTVHQYGLAHLLVVAAAFAVAALTLSRRR